MQDSSEDITDPMKMLLTSDLHGSVLTETLTAWNSSVTYIMDAIAVFINARNSGIPNIES